MPCGMAKNAAVRAALEEQHHKIMCVFEHPLATALAKDWQLGGAVHSSPSFSSGTVLFARISIFAQWSQNLSSTELSDVVCRLHAVIWDRVSLFGGHDMQFVGD